jgi:hypothetical protein
MFALEIPNLIKIKIGEGDTRADYGVGSPAEFRELLERVITEGQASSQQSRPAPR